MDYEFKDCIDAGSQYCPCHLAETGDCIVCSQLSGKNFCDCINWKGVCIYQEYHFNKNKAKNGREIYKGKIQKKEIYEDNLYIFTINVPHILACSLTSFGSFVFIRNPKTDEYFDTPISIMDVDTEENNIIIAIEKRGIKTKKICGQIEGEEMFIRGPFWNGVLGRKNINNAKHGVSLIICRGIGIAPGIPVIKKLHSNGNRIILLLDRKPFNIDFAGEYYKKYNVELLICDTLDKGELTFEIKNSINDVLNNEKINLIHCSGPDILIHELLSFIDPLSKFSCSNNGKMCCGEGVCGTCSTRYDDDKIKRLCKVQLDPKYVFKGRRSI
ncbi:MAG: sulfide/dihydroorotate dehydrogenase-like FAD/NAD-binding protein [Solirubrobacterales bacterium]